MSLPLSQPLVVAISFGAHNPSLPLFSAFTWLSCVSLSFYKDVSLDLGPTMLSLT